MFRFDNWYQSLTVFVAPDGVVAQLVERLNGIQEVRGSNPLGSTILPRTPLELVFALLNQICSNEFALHLIICVRVARVVYFFEENERSPLVKVFINPNLETFPFLVAQGCSTIFTVIGGVHVNVKTVKPWWRYTASYWKPNSREAARIACQGT